MHIAVTCVKDVSDVQPVFLAQLSDAPQYTGQLIDWNRSVQTHVIVDLPHRAERGLAPQPDACAFRLRCALAHLDWIMTLGNSRYSRKLRVDLGLAAFDLDNQQRLAVGVPCSGKSFGCANAQPVHELDGDGQNTRFNDVADTRPGNFTVTEPNENRTRAFRLWEDAQRCLGDDAQLPL